jgi:3-dehydroquinate synthase
MHCWVIEFLAWLEQHMDGLLAGDENLLAEAVYRSCAHKAELLPMMKKSRVSARF